MKKLSTLVVAPLIALGLMAGSGTVHAAGTTGTGSVTASFTSPVTFSGTASPKMTCSTNAKAHTYTVVIDKVGVDGGKVAGSATIRNYSGPGDYTATVVLAASKGKTAVAGSVKNVPVTVTSTGGTFSFSKTASGTYVPKLQGKVVTGTIAWTCPV